MKSLQNLSYKTLFTILFFAIAGIVFFLKIGGKTTKVSAAWWDEMWHYRKAISIGNSSGSTLTNQRVKITIDTASLVTAGKLQSDCDDIRITDINGNLLDHWGTECNTASSTIYFKMASIPTTENTIYFYYGNPLANSNEKTLGSFENPGTSCQMMKNQGSVTNSGLYYVTPGGNDIDKIQVYCDMVTLAGGWTLVLNNGAYTVPPKPNWNDIVNTVNITGSLSTNLDSFDLFLGVKHWNYLGSTAMVQVGSSPSNIIKRATYSSIALNTSNNYSLSLGTETLYLGAGTPGIKSYHAANNFQLSTYDGDHDVNPDGNCVNYYGNTAWWYGYCWSGNFWGGGDSGGYQNKPFWDSSETDYHNYGGIYIGGTDSMKNVSTGTTQSEESGGGPVAYWKFDEGVGTTAYDSSSSQNHGTISGATYVNEDQCISGKCLSFNGAQSVNSNYDVSWNNTNKISISFWVKPQNTTDINKGILGKPSYEWSIYQNNNAVSLVYWDNTGNHANGMDDSWGNVLTANNWTYLSYTWDGAISRFYSNGKLVKTKTSTNPSINMNNTNYMMFGGNIYTWGDSYFKGFLDEVKVYPYARTADQIKQDYNSRGSMSGAGVNLGVKSNTAPSLNSSLIAHWKLDEGNNTTIYDSSSNQKNITLTGTTLPSWQTTNKCRSGKCLYFNGVNNQGYVSTFSNNVLKSGQETSSWTLSAWVKPDGPQNGTERVILGRSGCHSGIYSYPNDFRFAIKTTNCWTNFKEIVYTPPNMTDWHHLVAVYNNRNMYFYADGKLIGTETFTDTIANHSDDFFLGGIVPWTFKGIIDEAKVYNRALTPEEIKQDYNAGSVAQFGSTTQNIGGTTTSLEYCIPGDTSYCASPVAEYNFEENTGTIVKDTSGNNNNLTTITGSPIWAAGKKGSALKFNNISDKVGNNSTNMNIINKNSGTMSMWIKATSFTENSTLYDTDGYYWLSFSSSGVLKWYSGNSNAIIGPTLSTNQWYFITVTWGNTGRQIYLNGIYQASDTPSSQAEPAANIFIGNNSSGVYPFKGTIDDVRIYNYIRTPAQIAYDYNRGAPIGWWKLDECQGSTAFDSSGLGNTGVISIGQSGTQTTLGTCQTGTSAAWTNGKNGKINSSLNFDGVDDYIAGSFNALGISKPFTLSAWFKTSTTFAYEPGIFSLGYMPVIVMRTDGKIRAWWYNGVSYPGIVSTKSYNDGLFHHATLTYDGNTAKLYVDANLEATTTSTIHSIYSGFEIGREKNVGNKIFQGQIDDVRIYNYALTSEQVKILYNGGSVNFQ